MPSICRAQPLLSARAREEALSPKRLDRTREAAAAVRRPNLEPVFAPQVMIEAPNLAIMAAAFARPGPSPMRR